MVTKKTMERCTQDDAHTVRRHHLPAPKLDTLRLSIDTTIRKSVGTDRRENASRRELIQLRKTNRERVRA